MGAGAILCARKHAHYILTLLWLLQRLGPTNTLHFVVRDVKKVRYEDVCQILLRNTDKF